MWGAGYSPRGHFPLQGNFESSHPLENGYLRSSTAAYFRFPILKHSCSKTKVIQRTQTAEMSFNPTRVASWLPSAAGFPAFPFQPICNLGRLTQICFSFVENTSPPDNIAQLTQNPAPRAPNLHQPQEPSPCPLPWHSTAGTVTPTPHTLGTGTNTHGDEPQMLGRSWA